MDKEILASVKADNDTLRRTLIERNKDLFEALSALSSMWNQYCPPPRTHMCRSAGEEAEEVLQKWKLIREDETGIYIDGMAIDDDVPQKVLDLLGISSTLSE
jgi:hypothetical protein